MKNQLYAVVAALGIICQSLHGQTNSAKSTEERGPFPTEDVIIALSKGGRPEQEKAIAIISQRSGEAAPPLLYLGAKRLYEMGKAKQAVFWLLAAQLRGRYDLMRCTDESAQKIIIMLNMGVAKPINDWVLENPDILLETLPKVMKWDTSTPFHYDARWIYYHANQPAEEAIKLRPSGEWPQILQQTRDTFEFSVRDYVAVLKNLAKKEAFIDLKKINEERAFALTRGKTYTLTPKEVEIEARALGFIASDSATLPPSNVESKKSPPASGGSPSPGSVPAGDKR